MSRQERDAVLAFLKSNDAPAGMSLAEQRTRMDSLAAFFPVPDGTEVEMPEGTELASVNALKAGLSGRSKI